ncbi:hypothetical protein DMH04_18670 [Kibdelosporangium aridum]|uniref:Uncharacterized protein n=2 Tax=Kibdelosporangium aridum TaxID=2030 RepID=A0A428ZA01_KIBAR|nr:hypothetical protein DMH04_18670 [Kibdelosporangium aridum]
MNNGPSYEPARLYELAAELDLLVSDVLVVAGHPVPARLRPPARDRDVMRAFARQFVTADHARLASVKNLIVAMASTNPAPEGPASAPAGRAFHEIFTGLLRNRGLDARSMPFTGLSVSTIYGVAEGRSHSLQQLSVVAGPLAWQFDDLVAIADEPPGDFGSCPTMCRHVGEIFIAAIPLTTSQLVEATPKIA